MKVKFTEDALNFLRDKNASEITIDLVNSKQCCGSGLPSSDTYLGAPKNSTRDYDVLNQDDIKINIDKSLKFKDDICSINLVKLVFTKSLVANFLDYDKLI